MVSTDSKPSEEWLASLASERFKPVIIVLDEGGCVSELVGDARYFGLPEIRKGDHICDQFDFLFGVDDLDGLKLEFIESPNGRALHAFAEAWASGGTRLSLIDATLERDQRQALQQKSNELALLNAEQVKLLAALQEKKQEAENLATLQSRFLASMSHDFRTPLASILTYADFLQTERGKRNVSQSAEAIKRGAQHLLNMVENLIGQAQLSLEGIRLNPQTVDMTTFREDLESLFLPLATAKGLRFSIEHDDNLPRYVILDPVRFRQICINLLGNACKYTELGQVSLRFSQLREQLYVLVSDTGPGISQAAQARIFDAFERGDATDSKGAGLGLHIVHQLVELMNGELSIRSTLGAGTNVSLTLPLLCPENIEGDPDPKVVIGSSKTVLVVEDDSDVYDVLAIYLDDAGFEVYHADSGLAALEMVRHERPDAVISDLNVPDLDGAALTQALRNEGYDGPVIILTASDLRRDRERAEQAGCSAYVVKPIAADSLVAMLQREGNGL